MNFKEFTSGIAAVAVWGCLACWEGTAETVVIAPSADTSLLENRPDFNLGADSTVPVGTLGENVGQPDARGLFRFDLSAIPVDANLESASLKLVVTMTPPGPGSVFTLHRMLVDWGEGNQSGGPPGGGRAVAGEATWNHRIHPDQAWGAAGGAEGVDYARAVSGQENLPSETGSYEFEIGAQGMTDLRQWLEEPERNFGWLLKSAAEGTARSAQRIATREHASSGPELTVVYSLGAPVPKAPLITEKRLEEGRLVVGFEGEAGVAYALEVRAEVAEGDWQQADLEEPLAEDGQVVLEGEASGVEGFYRVRAERVVQ